MDIKPWCSRQCSRTTILLVLLLHGLACKTWLSFFHEGCCIPYFGHRTQIWKKIFKKPIGYSIPMSCIIHVLCEQCHVWGLDWWAFRRGRLTSLILSSNGINLKYQINIYIHVLLKIKLGNLAIELNHEKFSWKDFLESTLNFKAKFLSFLKIFML